MCVQGLGCLGPRDEAAAAIVTRHFVFQLLTEGDWEWAIYVALHLQNRAGRNALVTDILGRFAPYRTRETNGFLSGKLSIPAELVHETMSWW